MESYKIENNRKEVFLFYFYQDIPYFNSVSLKHAINNFNVQFDLTGLEPIFVGFAGFDTSIQNSDVFVEPKKRLSNQYFSDFTLFLIAGNTKMSKRFFEDYYQVICAGKVA